jgi:hypothetical protein
MGAGADWWKAAPETAAGTAANAAPVITTNPTGVISPAISSVSPGTPFIPGTLGEELFKIKYRNLLTPPQTDIFGIPYKLGK